MVSDSDSSVSSLINSETEKEIVGDKRTKRPKSGDKVTHDSDDCYSYKVCLKCIRNFKAYFNASFFNLLLKKICVL